MHTRFGMAMLVAALVTLPAYAIAAQSSKPAAKPASTAKAKDASHATTGVVKSISDTSLVIAHGNSKGKEMTFVVNSSTQRDSSVAVGSMVSVRYHEEGKSMIASAIMAQPAKSTPSAAKTTTKK